MVKFFWRRIESLVQTAITNRILLFHKALIERGQIPPIQVKQQLQVIESGE